MLRPLSVFALLAIATSLSAQAKRAFQPSDWYKLNVLSAPAMSPNGSQVAFTVQTVNEKDNKYHREVWVVPTAGGSPQRFTSPSTESSNPRWSPDGKLLLFTSQRPGGRGSTWMLRMDQPGGEAFQDDKYPRAGSMPADNAFSVWAEGDSVAPDSAARANDPYAKMQAMARPPFGAITKPLDAARFDGRHVYDMQYKSNDQGFVPGRREARRWNPAQIWTQSFDGTAKKRITNTRYSHRSVAVSPDGQWIAFVADARLRPDSVVDLERDSLARLPYDKRRDDVDRNECRHLRDTDRRWDSEEGRDVLWRRGRSRLVPGQQASRVHRGARADEERSRLRRERHWWQPENLLGAWKYEPQSIDWLADGSIALTAATGGSTGVFKLDPATKKLTPVLSGRRRINGVSSDAKGTQDRVRRDRRHEAHRAVRRQRRRHGRAPAHELQRQADERSRVQRRRAIHVSSRSAAWRSRAG